MGLLGCSDEDAAGTASSGSTGDSPEETASACIEDSECYVGIEVLGDPLCLERVRDGHCTHTCTADADCCAADGECRTGLEQVCSPFESTGEMMCFLSCDEEHVGASDYADEGDYCQREVHADFICRSSGGGANNRKICVPGTCDLGASCATDADCATGLECIGDLPGGYCSVRDCDETAACPTGSACVVHEGVAYCAKGCERESDCSFCRRDELREATCSDQVEFAADVSDGSYCVPG